MGAFGSPFRWFSGLVPRTSGSGLADEVVAFLEGQLLERLRGRGESGQIEPWMWLNAVAHGSSGRVAELAAAPVTAPTGAPQWRDARVMVAREVSERCGGDEALLRFLQDSVLVPLELRLMGSRDLAPSRLAEVALAELSGSGA